MQQAAAVAAFIPRNEEEQYHYDQLWLAAGVGGGAGGGGAKLSGKAVVDFFSRSNIDKKILKEIWNLSVGPKAKDMTKLQFFTAMRAVCLIQNGHQSITADIISATSQNVYVMPLIDGVLINYRPQSREQLMISKINDDFLTCEICTVMYAASSDKKSLKIPKALECLHSFCKECLVRFLAPGATTIDCFVCRRPTALDKDTGVDSLKTNFMIQALVDTCLAPSSPLKPAKTASSASSVSSLSALSSKASNYLDSKTSIEDEDVCMYCPKDAVEARVTMLCLQCQDLTFCVDCSLKHKDTRQGRDHECVAISPSNKKKTIRKCAIHKNEEIKFICESCCKPHPVFCCQKCYVDNHHGHRISSVEKYASIKTEELNKELTKTEKLLAMQRAILESVEGRLNQHLDNLESNRDSLNNTCDIIREMVADSTKAWLDELETQGSDISKLLSADKKTVQIHIGNAELFIGQARNLMDSKSSIEIIEQKEKILEKLTEAEQGLIAPFQLNDVSAVDSGQINEAASELISSLTQLFADRPFKLPNTRSIQSQNASVSSVLNPNPNTAIFGTVQSMPADVADDTAAEGGLQNLGYRGYGGYPVNNVNANSAPAQGLDHNYQYNQRSMNPYYQQQYQYGGAYLPQYPAGRFQSAVARPGGSGGRGRGGGGGGGGGRGGGRGFGGITPQQRDGLLALARPSQQQLNYPYYGYGQPNNNMVGSNINGNVTQVRPFLQMRVPIRRHGPNENGGVDDFDEEDESETNNIARLNVLGSSSHDSDEDW